MKPYKKPTIEEMMKTIPVLAVSFAAPLFSQFFAHPNGPRWELILVIFLTYWMVLYESVEAFEPYRQAKQDGVGQSLWQDLKHVFAKNPAAAKACVGHNTLARRHAGGAREQNDVPRLKAWQTQPSPCVCYLAERRVGPLLQQLAQR